MQGFGTRQSYPVILGDERMVEDGDEKVAAAEPLPFRDLAAAMLPPTPPPTAARTTTSAPSKSRKNKRRRMPHILGSVVSFSKLSPRPFLVPSLVASVSRGREPSGLLATG